jgi:hypothetical protein
VIVQAEEDALVARVEAKIKHALSQPQFRTSTNPFGVLLPQQEDVEEEDEEERGDGEADGSAVAAEDEEEEDSEVADSVQPWNVVQMVESVGASPIASPIASHMPTMLYL